MRGWKWLARTAVILVLSVMFSCARSAPAQAADPVSMAASMAVLIGEVIAATTQQSIINANRGAILDATRNIQNRAILEQRFDTTMYGHDHRPLTEPPSLWRFLPESVRWLLYPTNPYRVDPTEITKTLPGFYTALAEGGGVSFSGADIPESFLTGRESVTSADFRGDYRTRAESLARYAEGVTRGNMRDLERLARYRFNLAFMLDALIIGDTKDKLTSIWKDEYGELKRIQPELPYAAATPHHFKDDNEASVAHRLFGDCDGEDFLEEQDMILTSPGYRRTIQASGQISNLKNHLVQGLRAGLARQAEADVRYAHNEQQEKADAHFAFEGVVGSWHSAGGTGY